MREAGGEECKSWVTPATVFSHFPAGVCREWGEQRQAARRQPIYSFIHSLTQSLTHSFIQSFTHAFTYSFTHLLTPSLTHSFTHSLIHSLPHSFFHSFSLQYVQWLGLREAWRHVITWRQLGTRAPSVCSAAPLPVTQPILLSSLRLQFNPMFEELQAS